MVTRYRATVEDYLAIPEEPPYLEYVHGEIVPKAMPDWDHSQLVKQFMLLFVEYERRTGGHSGVEIRVLFETERGREYRLPDYAYWTPGRPRRRRNVALPPTLAIEVRSPDESMAEQRAKCRYYLANGVDVAWLVDPESRTVEVFDEGRDGAVLSEDDALECEALPRLRVDLRQLFSVLDED